MIRALLPALALAFCGSGAWAQCRLALVLGLDVSGSVDAREYRLQLDGLATALGSADVARALLSDPSHPVRLAVFEWSGPEDQRLILPWTEVNSPSDIAQVQSILLVTERVPAHPSTGLGQAMRTGFALLDEQPDCDRHVLDLSGDGKDNAGDRPRTLTAPPDVIVNGLVVALPRPDGYTGNTAHLEELTAYYRAEIIRGPAAFVEQAMGFDDYERAMQRKLLRELQSLAIGLVGPLGQTRMRS